MRARKDHSTTRILTQTIFPSNKMDKDTLQKALEARAETRLVEEYDKLRNALRASPLSAYVEISDDLVVVFGQNGSDGKSKQMFPALIRDIKNASLLNAIDKRRKELVEEETQSLIKKVDSIGYLFEQVAQL